MELYIIQGPTALESTNAYMHKDLAKVWAKYCFPNEDWTSDQSLYKLYNQNKFLCGKHFNDSSFTSSERIRLHKFAIPTDAQDILAQMRLEVQASTSQCYSISAELSAECNTQSPTVTKVILNYVLHELEI
ncbi:unnamed protein product, partial [Brenthis ino]